MNADRNTAILGQPTRIMNGLMNPRQTAPQNIDEYIAGFPREVREILTKIRETIHQAAPDAIEAIRYQIPTFIQKGSLVHFGAFKKHIGFYATPSGNRKFQQELSEYPGGKGSVQFPLNQPIPYDLIGQIVRFRVSETTEKSVAKKVKSLR